MADIPTLRPDPMAKVNFDGEVWLVTAITRRTDAKFATLELEEERQYVLRHTIDETTLETLWDIAQREAIAREPLPLGLQDREV